MAAKVGSCIEIRCTVTDNFESENAKLFWMKDAEWTSAGFTGTVIYSKNPSDPPVSPDFIGRVTYVGSASWKFASSMDSPQKPKCNIRICNLQKSDSGTYQFRYIKGRKMWSTATDLVLLIEGGFTNLKII